MVWAVDALRLGESESVRGHLLFPEEAVGSKPGDKHFVAPWSLETLVNEALVHPSAKLKSKRLLNTRLWEAFATLYNTLNEIENSESLDDISESGLLDAMPRIAWRQFGWQSGYRDAQKMFRAWWLYNFPEANEYFLREHGVSVERFCYVGFAIAAQLLRFPAVRPTASLLDVGISDSERDAFFGLVLNPSAMARNRACKERAGRGPIAYKPSVLRRTPMIAISDGNGLEAFCPLPELLYLRFTDGLFYDLVGDDNLKRIIGERFESFVMEVTGHYLGGVCRLVPEGKYGPKGKRRATPDIRVVNDFDELRVVIECKSRRIPYKVRSSPNPFVENNEVYDDLVKGVVQIWRYMADVRREKADCNYTISADIVGVVLMLEPWLQMHAETIREIRERAISHCQKQPEIEAVDQIEIAFVAMDDWEYSIQKIGAREFLSALNRHASPKKHGYLLNSSIEELKQEDEPSIARYDYYGGISRLVSWWEVIDGRRVPKPLGHGE